jgi:putative hydrolase of the HAD superfamily
VYPFHGVVLDESEIKIARRFVESSSKLIEAHCLASFIGGIASIRKTRDAFRQLKNVANAERVVMVGDQLDRDIRAAAAAGFETFYFPGGFKPYWLDQTEANKTQQVSRYDEIVPYLT